MYVKNICLNNIKEVVMFNVLQKSYVHIILRFILLLIIVNLLNKETNEGLYSLAVLYISFLLVISAIKHKYEQKIMCLSFFIVILGVMNYLLRDAIIFLKLIIQLPLGIFITELFITTLNWNEVYKIFQKSFENSFDEFNFEKIINKSLQYFEKLKK